MGDNIFSSSDKVRRASLLAGSIETIAQPADVERNLVYIAALHERIVLWSKEEMSEEILQGEKCGIIVPKFGSVSFTFM